MKQAGLSLFLMLILPIFLFSACIQQDKSDRFEHLDQRTRIRLRQYLVEGKRLYNIHCANCHQSDGRGLARLYPPLKDSDYLVPNKEKVICGMRYGQKGEIRVNGIMFNQEMPANFKITDLEIAEIATYVYTEFADTVQIITLHDVKSIMDSCQKHLSKGLVYDQKNPGSSFLDF